MQGKRHEVAIGIERGEGDLNFTAGADCQRPNDIEIRRPIGPAEQHLKVEREVRQRWIGQHNLDRRRDRTAQQAPGRDSITQIDVRIAVRIGT